MRSVLCVSPYNSLDLSSRMKSRVRAPDAILLEAFPYALKRRALDISKSNVASPPVPPLSTASA